MSLGMNVEKLLIKVKKQHDDDLVDRTNYYYTPMMLGFFGLMLAAKQYIGDPLQCWLPAQFKDQWEKYAESYCFVENTYFVAFNETFPRTNLEREYRELPYYQWVPFMLAAQVVFFLLPKLMWNSLSLRTGVHINSLVEKAMMFKKEQNAKKKPKKTLKHDRTDQQDAAEKLSQLLDYSIKQKKLKESNTPSSYVTYLYMIFKGLNLLVCLIQLFMLNHFLASNYNFWGWDILRDLYMGLPWQHSGHFPRVTYCDINIREQGGHMVQHTFQCVLMINMLNEKVYLFIWFWLVFLASVDLFNLGSWLYRCWNDSNNEEFIGLHLIDVKNYCGHDMKKFVRTKLGMDGMTIIRLISANCGGIAASEIVTNLFKSFLEHEMKEFERRPKVLTRKMLGSENGKKQEQSARDNVNNCRHRKPNGHVKPAGANAVHPAPPKSPPVVSPPTPELKVDLANRASKMGISIEQSQDQNQAPVYIDNVVHAVKELDKDGEPIFPTTTIVPGITNN